MPVSTTGDHLSTAIEDLKAGRLTGAEDTCRAVLDDELVAETPLDTDSLY